jgi:hypothetical protein
MRSVTVPTCSPRAVTTLLPTSGADDPAGWLNELRSTEATAGIAERSFLVQRIGPSGRSSACTRAGSSEQQRVIGSVGRETAK